MATWDLPAVLMAIIGGLFVFVQFFIGFTLNNFSKKMDEMGKNLKYLNDKVLDEYVKKPEVDKAMSEMEHSIHAIRNTVQTLTTDVNVMKALKDRG